MITKKKNVIGFIEDIKGILALLPEEERKYILLKIALLKWLLDRQWIKWDMIMQLSLYKEFTFQNILYCWGGKRFQQMEKEHNNLDSTLWNRIVERLLGPTIFSKEDPTILGQIYEYLNQLEQKKKAGMYYTPFYVIDFMLKDEIKVWKVDDRIIDPACGCGFFLSRAYDALLEYYINHPILLGTDKKVLHEHIIEKNLYGIEKDQIAASITKLVLILKQPQGLHNKINVYSEDALLGDIQEIQEASFRLVIGNPPYIGHKKMDKEYSKIVKQKYSMVYQDKGDISYCFFQKGMELLQEGGSLCFITSRYFLEALHGAALREYLVRKSRINRIIDFYGQRILKGIGVDPLLITLTKDTQRDNSSNIIDIFKLRIINKNISGEIILHSIETREHSPYIHSFILPQENLKREGWRLLHPIAREIVGKIEGKSTFKLEKICESKQGIITGKDEAFVLSKESAAEKKLHKQFLRPWIKGKNIISFSIRENKQLLLYSNDMEDINEWETEKKHLTPYKSQLEKRRECIAGTRKWFELQWGREKNFFENPKIIFPYKASTNKFVLDEKGNYYSADVYGIRIKEQYTKSISYSSLVLLLNSRVYEFYFKGFAKKLGEDLYEYYPNTLMQLAIPKFQEKEQEKLQSYYKEILENEKKENQVEMKNIQYKVDQWLMKYFEFTPEEKRYLRMDEAVDCTKKLY